MGDPGAVDTVRGLGLAPEAEAAILAGNAERLTRGEEIVR
jgi:hypothetical protein